MIAPQLFYNALLTMLAVPALPLAGLALAARPRYRLGLSQRLGFVPAEVRESFQSRQPLWVHAPSVGESLATRPFLRELKRCYPASPLLFSTLTPTAQVTVQQQLPEADAVIYFPLDHPLCIWPVLHQLAPAAFFFSETEMWPNFLLMLAQRRIPTFLVSGRFSARAQARYRWLSPLFHPVFRSLTHCCMQTSDDAERLVAAGAHAEQVTVTGNFKMDGVHESSAQGVAILQDAGLASRPLLIGASTHPGEEEFLLQVFRRLQREVPQLLLLLAPRHPQRFAEVARLLTNGHYRFVARSQPLPTDTATADVFLLDTLGELASFYPAATATFVGGSLVKGPGGHSVVEPALAHTPVLCGPHTHNFTSVVEQLQQAGGGIIVRTTDDCYQRLLPFFRDPQKARAAGQHAYSVVQQGQGAVARTMTIIQGALSAYPNNGGQLSG